VNKAGYKVVWTPYAMLIHHSSKSMSKRLEELSIADQDAFTANRQARYQERLNLWRKWMPLLVNDPAYNRNLVLLPEQSIDLDGARWDKNIESRIKYLAVTDQGANSQLPRLKNAFEEMNVNCIAQCDLRMVKMPHTDIARIAPHTVVFQQAIDPVYIELANLCKNYIPDVFCVMLVDETVFDFSAKSITSTDDATCKSEFALTLKNIAQSANRLIVASQAFAEFCKEIAQDVKVIPECLNLTDWSGLNLTKCTTDKCRVAWIGDEQNLNDLKIISDVIIETADSIDWVLMGTCPEYIKPYVTEVYEMPTIADYPTMLAGLQLDLAVYPQASHPLNFIRSHRLILELGMVACPVLASDNVLVAEDYVYRVNNDVDAWTQTLNKLVVDKSSLQKAGLALNKWVKANHLLDCHVNDWAYALTDKPQLVEKGIQLTQAAQAV
jgi:hypothetical protein